MPPRSTHIEQATTWLSVADETVTNGRSNDLLVSGAEGYAAELDLDNDNHDYGWLDEVVDEEGEDISPETALTQEEYERRMEFLDMETIDLIVAQQSINLSVYPKLCSAGAIAGIHSGRILLHLCEQEIQEDTDPGSDDGNDDQALSDTQTDHAGRSSSMLSPVGGNRSVFSTPQSTGDSTLSGARSSRTGSAHQSGARGMGDDNTEATAQVTPTQTPTRAGRQPAQAPKQHRRVLVNGNTTKLCSGGQIYIPLLKRIMKSSDTTKDKIIPSLPAMLQHLLTIMQMLPDDPANKATIKSLHEMISYCVKKLHDLFRNAKEEIQNTANHNSIRYEMFVAVKSNGQHQPFQQQDYVRGWLLSPPNKFFAEYSHSLMDIMDPLRHVCFQMDHGNKPWAKPRRPCWCSALSWQ